MEYTVIKTFRDKYTNKLYAQGSTYKPKDAERAEKLIGLGFLQAESLKNSIEPKEDKKQSKQAKQAKQDKKDAE